MKRLFIFLIVFLISTSVYAQYNRKNFKEPTIKMGVEHASIIDAAFSIKNTTTFAAVDSRDDGVGAVFNAEYVIKSRYGIGFHYGTINREHTFTFEATDLTAEDAITVQLFDFRTYFMNHMRNGFKPNAGVMFGTYDVTTNYTTSNAALSDKSTSAKADVVGLHIGTDYIMDAGGVRFSLGYMDGNSVDEDSITDYRAMYDFSSTTLNIGFFLFF